MKHILFFTSRVLFFSLFFFCHSHIASALPTIVKVEEVKGQCVSDCGIIIHASNLGTNVKYGLLNYPSMGQTRTQLENVFTDLGPGTYTIGVYDNTTGDNPVRQTITITTVYNEMFLNAPSTGNNQANSCADNGTLTISLTGGKAPFRYKIMGPVTREVTGQTAKSYTFRDLPSGSYTIEVQDACDQWRRNKPESPVVVSSYVNPYLGLTFQSLTITKDSGNTYFYASSNICTTVSLRLTGITDVNILQSNGTTVNGTNSTLKYYVESPANSDNWSASAVSGASYMHFNDFPYNASNRTYRIKVRHPCTNAETISGVLTFPPEPTTFYVSANSNSQTYTDFCNSVETPSVTVRINNVGNDIIRDFGCGSYKYTLKKGGVIVDERTSNLLLISYNKSHGLVGGEAYTLEIVKDGTIVFPTVPFTVRNVAAGGLLTTTFRHSYDYYTAGYNYGRTCDFEHTRLWAYRGNVAVSGTVKYTILEPTGYNDIFPAKTTTSYSQLLWDNVPFGTYKIRQEFQGCAPRDTTITIDPPFKGFNAEELTYVGDGTVCGMNVLQGKGYYVKADGTRFNNTSTYTQYYIQIVEGPKRSDGTPTVGLRSSATYSSGSYSAAINNLPGGAYKVIFYSIYATVTATGGRYNLPNCHYVEKTIYIPTYQLPKLDVPKSGGISCSKTGGQSTLTITAKGDRPPFLYRYKKVDDPDSAYPEFSAQFKYDNLNAGKYTVQILDQCGNIGTQDATIFNSGDQIIEIIGGVDDEDNNTVICRGQQVTLQVKSIGPVDSYQWFKSPFADGPWEELTDAGQHYFYKIDNVQPGDEGFYRVVIDNTSCIISSSVHIVGVREPIASPTITGPTKVCLGTTFKLQANTAIPSVSFQWYRNGAIIDGANSSEYETTISGDYTAIVLPTIGCPSNPSAIHSVVTDPDACVEANDDEFTMNACEGGRIIDVLANDKAGDCPVDISIKIAPSNGTAEVVADGGVKKIRYTPNATFTGEDVLTYEIACGTDKSTATLKVMVKSVIMVEVIDHASEPAVTGKFRIRFTCNGVKYSKKLIVKYTIGGSAVANTDYTLLSGTIEIPANQTSVDLIVDPKNNFLVEGDNRNVEVTIVSITEAP